MVQTGWVDDLVGLFNSSIVYLYDSADYWRASGLSEGFVFHLEGCLGWWFLAAETCIVDFLTPGDTAHKLGCGSIDFDYNEFQCC